MKANIPAFLRAAGCGCKSPRLFNKPRYIGCGECGTGYKCDAKGFPATGKNGSPGRCHYCKQYVAEITVDHIVPQALGGPNRTRNYVNACAVCNGKKADQRSSCECTTCLWAWLKWGPLGWTQLPRWTCQQPK